MTHVQERPVCFDCEKVIESMDQVIFAPPFDDQDARPVSACFHGLCLMRWRERRQEWRAKMQAAHEAFQRHLNGECGCPDE